MNNAINLIARNVFKQFVYTSDTFMGRRFGMWRFPRLRNGVYKGDCEDFALIVAKHYYGGKIAAFKAFKSGEAKIIRVGIDNSTHAMLVINNRVVVDNNGKSYTFSIQGNLVLTYRTYRFLRFYSFSEIVLKVARCFVLDVLTLNYWKV